mmetsp:Transcript_33409/g.76313  ORF Transcript_33409/g.76313 Transcript_33409/m.76313 type:complete len:541 (-) Transcript_33409:250-1872(-)
MNIRKGQPPLVPVRNYEVSDSNGTVKVAILVEGDGSQFPQRTSEVHVTGRLRPSGCVFESTRGKAKPPMKMVLHEGTLIKGMELALPTLSLGTCAVVEIPAELGYGQQGVPRMIPPGSDLCFELEIAAVDGHSMECVSRRSPQPDHHADEAAGFVHHPFWLAQQELPPATSYYVNFCRHVACKSSLDDLPKAKPIPRKTRQEATGWDVRGSAVIISGAQDDWRARSEWDWDWFRRELGEHRQLLKWIGPVFTQKENLWDQPIWEASVAEYIDYVRHMEAVDPNCDELNAAVCPRLYLNGWPCFVQLPHLQDYITNPVFFDDATRRLFREHEELRESFLASLANSPTPQADRDKGLAEEYWEMSKLFLSPKGAITRLHYDNGGAHAWLSQVRGRKLFICFQPSDTQYLHAFEGDEGLLNGSWVDPLDPEAETKWPEYWMATPYVGVLEEGEMLVAPQGWWHYAVALDSSITVMRNFYSESNKAEYFARKDKNLEQALINSFLRPRSKGKSEEQLRAGAKTMIAKVREVLSSKDAGKEGAKS